MIRLPFRVVPSWAALLVACLLPLGSLAAEGLKIEPGKWKIQNKRTSKINGANAKPMNTTKEECMGDQLTLDELGEEAQSNNCSSDNVKASDGRLEWDLSCEAQGGQATGSSVYETSSGGKKITGTTKMKVTGRLSMTVRNEFTATHQGPCD